MTREKNLYQDKIKFLVFILFLVFFGVLLLVRLIDIQIIRGDTFLELADDNRLYTLPVPAPRGVFFDRYKDSLVYNDRVYYYLEDAKVLYPTQEHVLRDQALAIMATDSASIVSKEKRVYKYPSVLANTLGYVGQVTADDIKENPQLLPISLIGKSGLERLYNSELMGVDGKKYFEINARGERQRLVDEKVAIPGKNIQTTLDPYLSQVAYQALGNQKGVVIISDAKTGQILSLVNKPSFDANLISTTEDNPLAEESRKNQVNQWFEDEDEPFFNRALMGIYPPGSIFKIVTAMAGLENGKIDQSTTVNDEGSLKVGEYEYRSWFYWNYGRVEGEIAVEKALARSNDIFFYKVAEWVGPQSLADMARMFGFGSSPDIGMTAAKGIVPDPVWKEQTIGEKWYLGNTYHFGIGQGDILVSPLQIQQMLQTVANTGEMCTPSIVQQDKDCFSIGIHEENINLVLSGMLDACSSNGTAYPFFPYNAEKRQEGNSAIQDIHNGAVACKTGTAEWGGVDERGYRKTHGWWVGILELESGKLKVESGGEQAASSEQLADKGLEGLELGAWEDRGEWLEKVNEVGFPERIVITVLVESDEENPYKEGSSDASPVGKEIVDWLVPLR